MAASTAVLIWPTYPNMGIDDRNQHDMVRGMPGGVDGVRQMVADFHRRGVRVLFPMMMWDQGTRDPGKPWPDAIAELMAEVGADGINGDTQDGVPLAFSLAADKTGHPLAFEPEGGPSDEALAWNVMTWGQYQFPFVPLVDRYKWLEPRHMVNISDRWNRDKTDDLQFAFFNGVGWESWENIWGIWNGITPRDARSHAPHRHHRARDRAFSASARLGAALPMLRYGVFASRWPLGNRPSGPSSTAMNTTSTVRKSNLPRKPGCATSISITAWNSSRRRMPRVRHVLSFAIEAHGYGAVLATHSAPDSGIQALMAKMKAMTAKPLASYSHEWKVLPQQIVPIAPTKRAAGAPTDMVKIPGGGFSLPGRRDRDRRRQRHRRRCAVSVGRFAAALPRAPHAHQVLLDRQVSGHQCAVQEIPRRHALPSAGRPQFPADWKNGSYPAGWDNKPVTWVSLEDARAYAAWAGKRLPHEWEWQYAAQGTDGRTLSLGQRLERRDGAGSGQGPHHARRRMPWMRIPRAPARSA